jgi:outer membrane receptor protein involved in Fe transport
MLMLATPLAAVAQNTGKISGRVVDDLGDPLPGANVVVGGTQLGAATDIDGNYFIIGIPVGEYDVTASFVGYQTQTVEGVQIATGYTTQQDFELGPQELGTVTVTYERPIIQKDAIGAPKVVTGEQIENLPVRGVADVAAIQSGVISNEGSSDLFVRGGREQEVVYYVDGVKITGNAAVGVNQQAIQEQEMLIGTIPARYGDALSGVISITTKSGANKFFGSAEFLTSEVLDAYGYNVGSLNIGGPIVPGKASFFASVGGRYEADRNPYGIDVLQLTDEAQAALDESFEVLRVVNPATGEEDFISLPFDQLEGAAPADVLADPSAFGIDVPEGFELSSSNGVADVIARTDVFTREDFTSSADKDAPLEELTFNGNITLNPIADLTLRVGGVYETLDRETFDYDRSFYNLDSRYNDERDTWRVFGTFRQRLSDNAFYQIQGEYQNWKFNYYPQRFSDDVSDALFYGDLDHEANAAARRYLVVDQETGLYRGAGNDGSYGHVGGAYGFFDRPGNFNNFFQKEDQSTLRFSGNATTQLGLHQIEFGAEFEQQTQRRFQFTANQLAIYYDDGDVEAGGEGVSSYDQLTYDDINTATGSYLYYGYSFNGLEEVDDQDVTAFGNDENYNVAPYEPIYYAGYIQDKIEYRDLVINLGLRVDVFDNNTLVLRDKFAPFPIRRANDLVNPESEFFISDYTLPGGVEGDYAAYFSNPNDASTIVGFRDLDGTFYDLDGNEIDEVELESRGQISQLSASRAVTPEMFEDYEPQVTFMPRVGVSFPVTDRALFFASYNVTSQRPTEFAFSPFSSYDELSSGTTYRNPDLKPEETTQYELGFRQRVGERAALTLSGFYRTQDNKIGVRNLDQFGAGGNNSYNTFLNVDRTTSKGVELGFDLRRTNNVAINANYTLSFAEGTGSDAQSAGDIAWLGREFPVVIFPTDFDRRHVGNVSVDYRLGEGEGPMIGGAHVFENFGINILGSFKSGLPYSPTVNTGIITTSAALFLEGGINSARLPASTQINLKIDREFDLGFGDFRAYLWVQNLLDTDAPLTVYRFTGQPETGGFLGTPGGQAAIQSATLPD